VGKRRPTKEAAAKIWKAARDGNVTAASEALLALWGLPDPSPEQAAGAILLAFGLNDLHAFVREK
jgi:hypothetical protein